MVYFRLISAIVIVLHDVSGKLSCTFDLDLCSWTQRRDDHFDWIQQSGSTNDPTSGPEVDHTSGNGKYLLISGEKTHGLGWEARLSSPNLIVTRETNMTFWYHMNGVGIGNLTVTTTDRYGRTTVIWQKHDRQSPEWQSATVPIGLLTSFITFEGSTKFHYSADIALDDIRLSSEPLELSTQKPAATLTTTTSAHHDGNYLLLNGHRIHNENMTAVISSPLINIQQNTNLTFWYHMNGVGIGHLAVFSEYTNGRRETILSMSGRQGADWQRMSIILPVGLYKLVFEGGAKHHYGSDLALDDIQIHGHPVETLNMFG